MYSDSDSFDYDFEDEEYASMEPTHISGYTPLTEPHRDPIDDLKIAIFRFDGNLNNLSALVDKLSPQLESSIQQKSLHTNGSSHVNGNALFYSDDENDEEDETTPVTNAKSYKNEILFSNGWTPLIQASHLGLHEIVSLLIDRKFNVNYKATSNEITALLAACSVPYPASSRTHSPPSHDKVVQILLTAGADISTFSGDNQAIHLAAMNNRYSTMEILVNGGADINSRNKVDRTPLMLAAEKGHMRTINTILQLGALPALEDRNGNTAAYLAGISGFSHLADTLATISGEAAKDDRLYRAWWLVKKALNEEKSQSDSIGQSSQTELEKLKMESNYDELASFCYGLELGHLLPIFRNQKINMADLKRMSDTDLMKIGVDVFQDRKKILDLVQEMHKRPWQDESSLPKFDYGKPLKPSDLINMMGNTCRHLEFMDATIGYLSNHVRNNTGLYLKETDDVPQSIIVRLSDKCDEAIRYIHQLHSSCVQMRRFNNQLMETAHEDTYPDLITEESGDEVKKSSVKYSRSIAILGISVCVALWLGRGQINSLFSKSQLLLSNFR